MVEDCDLRDSGTSASCLPPFPQEARKEWGTLCSGASLKECHASGSRRDLKDHTIVAVAAAGRGTIDIAGSVFGEASAGETAIGPSGETVQYRVFPAIACPINDTATKSTI